MVVLATALTRSWVVRIVAAVVRYSAVVPETETRTLELRDYLRVVWRRKWTILVTVVLCVAAAVLISLREAPKYSTAARLLVATDLSDQIFDPSSQAANPELAQRTIANEIQLILSPSTRRAVIEKLDRPLASEVSLQPIPQTDVIAVVATDGDAEDAAATANAYAETYLEVRVRENTEELQDAADRLQAEIDRLTQQILEIDGDLAVNPPPVAEEGQTLPTDPRVRERASLDSQRSQFLAQLDRIEAGVANQQVGGEVIAQAPVPDDPINKTPLRNALAGLALGLVLGIALAFLREYLDDSVKSKDDLEAASGITVVGLIPELSDWKNRKAAMLAAMDHPRSRSAEAYRTLRTSIEFLALDQPIRSMQVTSATAAEGKTTTLANVATTFARAGQRVIVLDCDLRRPRVHDFFGLENRAGFTSVLLGELPLAKALQPVHGNLPLGVLASGPLPPNPAELLSSKRAADVIEALESRCDLLLIDSPPIVPVTDGLVLAGLVDAVLVVANSGTTTKRGLGRAVELLRQIDAPLVGTVLNGVRVESDYGYAVGKEYYYAADQRRGAGKSRSTNGDTREGAPRARVGS